MKQVINNQVILIDYRSEDCPPPRKQTKLLLLREDAFTTDDQVTFAQDMHDITA